MRPRLADQHPELIWVEWCGKVRKKEARTTRASDPGFITTDRYDLVTTPSTVYATDQSQYFDCGLVSLTNSDQNDASTKGAEIRMNYRPNILNKQYMVHKILSGVPKVINGSSAREQGIRALT